MDGHDATWEASIIIPLTMLDISQYRSTPVFCKSSVALLRTFFFIKMAAVSTQQPPNSLARPIDFLYLENIYTFPCIRKTGNLSFAIICDYSARNWNVFVLVPCSGPEVNNHKRRCIMNGVQCMANRTSQAQINHSLWPSCLCGVLSSKPL